MIVIRNWNLMSVFSSVAFVLSSKLHGMSCFSQFSRVRGFVDTESKTEGFTVSHTATLDQECIRGRSVQLGNNGI